MKLSLKYVPDPVQEYEVVDVPEFGTDDDGNDWQVNAYPMTAATQSVYTLYISKFEVIEDEDGQKTDERLYAGVNLSRSSMCALAALCSRDDEGELVFGVDYQDAITRVESLHKRYYPAISRIALTVLRLSKDTLNPEKGVKAAEKN